LIRTSVLVAIACVAGCIEPVDARWQLDHDHVVVARATPPRVPEGTATTLDALVAHDGGPVTVEDPITAELSNAPVEMARYLEHTNGKWTLHAPDAATLVSTRPLLGLPADSPVPVDLVLTFPNGTSGSNRAAQPPFRVKKTVWLGETSENPLMSRVYVGDARAEREIVVPIGVDTYVSVDVGDAIRVNWLTNVGTLFQDDVERAFVRVLPEDRHEGELVVVLRDNEGGVAWKVFPMRAE
jgi:hypothetical protein